MPIIGLNSQDFQTRRRGWNPALGTDGYQPPNYPRPIPTTTRENQPQSFPPPIGADHHIADVAKSAFKAFGKAQAPFNPQQGLDNGFGIPQAPQPTQFTAPPPPKAAAKTGLTAAAPIGASPQMGALPQAQTMPGTITPAQPVSTAQTLPSSQPATTLTPAAPLATSQTKPATITPAAPLATPKTMPGPTSATPTDTAKQNGTAPLDDINTLRDYAFKMMSSQEDEVAKRQFNIAVQNAGLNNQAAREALQAQINSDPNLRGQPAGTALLAMMASNQNFNLDQMIGQLSVESANRILDLNKWGFDQATKITEYRQNRNDKARSELLQAGDFDSYAKRMKDDFGIEVNISALKSASPAQKEAIDTLNNAMLRNVAAGNMDAARRNFEAIKALSPDLYGGIGFEDAISGAEAFKLQSEQKNDTLALVRNQVAQGNLTDAWSGLGVAYSESDRHHQGSDFIQNTDLAELNSALKAAGLSEVADKADLIGREDDVFRAMQIAKISKNSSSTSLDSLVDSLKGDLKGLGYDITDPEADRALRLFVFNLQHGEGITFDANGEPHFDTSTLTNPWDEKSSSSYLFSDWPVMDETGKMVYSGWQPYGEDNEITPEEHAHNEELNTKWIDYVGATPEAKRLTRKQWFYATKGGTQEPDLKAPGVGDTTPITPPTELEITKAMNSGSDLTKQYFDEGLALGLIDSYQEGTLPYDADLLGKTIAFGGKQYKVSKVEVADGDNRTITLTDPQGGVWYYQQNTTPHLSQTPPRTATEMLRKIGF